MADRESPLPDDVPELGYIYISVGMGEDGLTWAWSKEGLGHEPALGYLMALSDELRDDLRFVPYEVIELDEEEDD